MPAGFTASLATRLDGLSTLTVREATGGEALDPRHIYLAPGGAHLRMADDRRVRLSDDPPLGGLRPRADLTIADAAKLYGSALVLVVLTGMGKDGLEGARAVKAAGGRVLVEAESTCVVYGMPRAVAEAGLADEVLPLHELPAAIARGGRSMSVAPTRTTTAFTADLKADDFVALCEQVRQLCGVDLAQYKRSQMERRVRTWAERRGTPDLVEYGRRLRRDPEELEAFLDRVTINVSHLWRHEDQFETLRTQAPARAGRAPAAEDLERRLLLRRRGVHDRRDLPRGDPDACRWRSSAPTSTSAWSPAPAKATSPPRMPARRRRPLLSVISCRSPTAAGTRGRN